MFKTLSLREKFNFRLAVNNASNNQLNSSQVTTIIENINFNLDIGMNQYLGYKENTFFNYTLAPKDAPAYEYNMIMFTFNGIHLLHNYTPIYSYV